MYPDFINRNLISFVKSEYKNSYKKTEKKSKIITFFPILLSSLLNYPNKKGWNDLYNGIKTRSLNFYYECEISIKANEPSLFVLVKNQDKKRITFNFKKCHIGILNHSIYFFPYSENQMEKFEYPYEIGKPFRIVYNESLRKDQYSTIETFKNLISIEIQGKTTKLKFEIEKPKIEIEMIINRNINVKLIKNTVANTV
jgi:hypothetical protein